MTDSELLRAHIKVSGLSEDFIAHELGISMKRLQNKIDGKTQFKADELCFLVKHLKLTERQIMDIFFPEHEG